MKSSGKIEVTTHRLFKRAGFGANDHLSHHLDELEPLPDGSSPDSRTVVRRRVLFGSVIEQVSSDEAQIQEL